MASRQERNEDAFGLGFTGKDGSERGALDARIEYHKSEEFREDTQWIREDKEEHNFRWNTEAINFAADVMRDLRGDLSDNEYRAQMHNAIIFFNANPDLSMADKTDQWLYIVSDPLVFNDWIEDFSEGGDDLSSWGYYHFNA